MTLRAPDGKHKPTMAFITDQNHPKYMKTNFKEFVPNTVF